MNITIALIDKLLKLRHGESLPASSLRGEWVDDMLRDGVLISRSHGSRRTLSASAPDRLELSLANIDERLGNLEQMRSLMAGSVSRAGQAAETGNSKLVSARSCPGFPVNTLEPLACALHSEDFVISPLPGSFLFVADWQDFSIPDDVVVVGIENMENFRMIRRQASLFASLLPGQRLLFVSRYPQSSDLRSWLQTIPNRYVHFGDFDLAGISIFLTEFHRYLPDRASFLIPADIEERLRSGSPERYNAQYQKFRSLSTSIPPLQCLIDMINKYHRGYDQEGYINCQTEIQGVV